MAYPPEHEMSGPIKGWLNSRQCRAYAEVPFTAPVFYVGKRSVDFVGTGFDGYMIAIEMKKSLSWRLSNQARSVRSSAHRVYCAVYCTPHPRSLPDFLRHGIGIVRVANGLVEVLVESVEREPSTVNSLEIDKGVLNGIAGLQTGGGL